MEKTHAMDALAGLAQETRLDIFRLLVQSGGEGLPAGRIGVTLGLPSPTLSFHLSQLKNARLISCRRDGRSLIYSARLSAVNELIGFLTENCCGSDAGACDIELADCEPAQLPRFAPQDAQ